jgi:hypothetical protein
LERFASRVESFTFAYAPMVFQPTIDLRQIFLCESDRHAQLVHAACGAGITQVKQIDWRCGTHLIYVNAPRR